MSKTIAERENFAGAVELRERAQPQREGVTSDREHYPLSYAYAALLRAEVLEYPAGYCIGYGGRGTEPETLTKFFDTLADLEAFCEVLKYLGLLSSPIRCDLVTDRDTSSSAGQGEPK